MSTQYSSTSSAGEGIDRPKAVQRTLGKARGYAQVAVCQARNKMTEYREHGWGRVQGDVVESTRSRPLAALGIAAAIGLLIGLLSSTVRRLSR
jgi:ElaB/YqjD/DUF883 family membrane-anchored ribosome-binding protein